MTEALSYLVSAVLMRADDRCRVGRVHGLARAGGARGGVYRKAEDDVPGVPRAE